MILRGRMGTLRPGSGDDVARLTSILNEPEVSSRWGGPWHPGEVSEQLVHDPGVFVIEVEDEVIGAIQFDEEDDQMYRHASVDIFVSTSRTRQGFGSDAIRTLVRYLFEERGHHRLTIDPSADNEPAIRVYERIGFRRVGVMRSYERGQDGTWHDGLLMDMLLEDFRGDPGDGTSDADKP